MSPLTDLLFKMSDRLALLESKVRLLEDAQLFNLHVVPMRLDLTVNPIGYTRFSDGYDIQWYVGWGAPRLAQEDETTSRSERIDPEHDDATMWFGPRLVRNDYFQLTIGSHGHKTTFREFWSTINTRASQEAIPRLCYDGLMADEDSVDGNVQTFHLRLLPDDDNGAQRETHLRTDDVVGDHHQLPHLRHSLRRLRHENIHLQG